MQNRSLIWVIIIVLILVAVFILINKAPERSTEGGTPTGTENGTATGTGETTTPPVTPEESGTISYENATADDITVQLPYPGAVTGKQFSVIGKARGPWFFEASFPVQVLDQNGRALATAVAQAEGEWMTTEFVPFKADITVPESYIGEATLVLHKDNPSGLPEHEASVSFPITIEY